MAQKSTRYLLLVILIVAIFILLLLLIKEDRTPLTEQPRAIPGDMDPAPSEEPLVQPVQPSLDYLPTSSGHQIVRRKYYILAYSEEHEQAAWIAYELTEREVGGSYERTDDFREDPDIATGSATLEDYYRSGYDRGHLAPAGDMKFSEEAMSESFYMSNMSPQEPAFNRGIWRELEEEVRELAVQNGSLYVVTGPVFGKRNKRIGKNRVSVPRAFYKVLLDYTEPEVKAIAFLLPNQGSQQEVYDFAVSIDSVEQVTGIDFFPALPDLEENQLESDIEVGLWLGSS